MITEPVTKEQLDRWKKLWEDNRDSIQTNRITGQELDKYFRKKYLPQIFEDKAFKEAVKENLLNRYGEEAAVSSRIICYLANSDIYVGIDLNTGFFHLESENIEKCVPIYDDLFIKRGLDEADLHNYVLTGQYIELAELGD